MTKYFTPAALPITKRDLAKLGVDSKAKLSLPFRANRIVCKLTVTVRTLDDGTSGNEVRQLDVIRVQEPEADPFASPGERRGCRVNHPTARYGFRVVGGKDAERRLTDAAAAFRAHCAADPKAEPDNECYLSAFQFEADFKTYLSERQTTKHYAGPCWLPWVWFDLDRDEPAVALADVRRLVGYLLMRYHQFDADDVLAFFSGAKGYHVGVPLSFTSPSSVTFNTTCRQLAEAVAAEVGVRIDTGIYDRVRLLRAPNSRHTQTGLHKIRLTHDELTGLTAERVRELARHPIAFEVPEVAVIPPLLVENWQRAEQSVIERQAARATAPVSNTGRLNRSTLEFIANGATDGERRPRLFRAAANLREFGCPPELAHALLTEAALDCGLSPSDVKRQIECGITHADGQAKGGAA